MAVQFESYGCEMPKCFTKNGKKPQTITDPKTGINTVINSTTGEKFSKQQMKEFLNEGRRHTKLEKNKERLLKKLESRRLTN